MATRESPDSDASGTAGPHGGGDRRGAVEAESGQPGEAGGLRGSAGQGAGAGGWRVEQITDRGRLEDLAPAWRELFGASGTTNPFAHPAWLTTWAEHFVEEGSLRLVAVWEREALVALAPFYREAAGAGPAGFRRLRLVGAGQEPLTELAQILALPSRRRRAVRSIVEDLHGQPRDWDWIEIFVGPEHGWLEPESVPAASGSMVMSLFTHACVIVPLPGSWDELRRQLKRNVSESIRRSRNRLERDGHAWSVRELAEPAQVEAGFTELLALHRARAALTGRAPRRDRLADPRHEAFAREAVVRMAGEGLARIHLLDIDGAPAGGLVALHTPETVFLSLSGYDPRWWEYGVLNLLTAEVMRAGIRDGAAAINLSSGPENTKLRWSERIEVHQLFAIVAGARRSRMAFGAFQHARAASQLREGHRVAKAVAREHAATERRLATRGGGSGEATRGGPSGEGGRTGT